MRKAFVFIMCLAVMLSGIACQPAVEPVAAGPGAEAAVAPEPAVEAAAESSTEPVSEDGDDILICCVAGEVGIPYFTTMQWGARDAARDLGVEIYWTGAADWDVASQMKYIDACLALNPDGILLVPSDNESLVAYVDTWMKDGIGVVCADYALAEHVDIVGLESNSYNGGVEAAKYMFEVNGPGGTYQPLGSAIGSYSTQQRCGGFIDTMKELDPAATILETVYANYEATTAANLISGVIMANPDLNGVFAASSAVAAGASTAIIEAGLSGKVKLAAFDADPQQIEDLEEGIYDVVIAQDPYQMGYDAVKILVQYAKGEVANADYPDAIIEYPTKALTRDNCNNSENAKYKYIADITAVGYTN